MKNIKYVISMICLTIFAISCDDREEFEDLPSADYRYVGMVRQGIPNGNTVFEGTGSSSSSIDIPLYYYLGGSGNAAEITISVSGAILGEDFIVPNSVSVSGQTFNVNLPGDTTATFFTIEPLANDVQNDNKPLTLSITGLPDGVFAGAPVSAEETIVILDDDCPYGFERFVGTASVIENGSVGPYDVITTVIGPNTVLTDNFWDSGIAATFVFVPCDGTVQIPQQSTPAFGDPDGNIVGSGTWNDETGEVVINVTISFPAFSFVSVEQHVYQF